MGQRRRVRHNPEQIVKKLRDADAMLNAGKDLAAVLQALEVSESTLDRWRKQFGGMKSEEAKRLKELEDENRRLKAIVADQALDIQMLKHLQKGDAKHESIGKPFSEESGGERTRTGVRDLRTKGVRSSRSAA